jgi:hypothetical protein
MPRTENRGGARTGTPGKSYSNRTDMTQPVQTAPNQAYGAAGQQAQSQQTIPLPSSAGELAKMAQGAQQPQMPQAGPQQPNGPVAGDMGALSRMTDHPMQPVTHGAPTGPGPGPESLGGPLPNKVSSTIAQIAAASGNPDLQVLAARAQAQGQ